MSSLYDNWCERNSPYYTEQTQWCLECGVVKPVDERGVCKECREKLNKEKKHGR